MKDHVSIETEYESRVTWEELVIGPISEGGGKSFQWVERVKEFEYDSGFFTRDMSYAAEQGKVPNQRTGVSNTLVRNVVEWRRPKQEWRRVES